MRYEFEYQYSDELLRAASRRNILHQLGGRVPVMAAVLLALIAALCLTDEGDYLCGVLQGAFAMLVILIVLAHVGARERALRFGRKLPTRTARCVVADEAITVESALAASTVKWPVVQQVVRGPDVWLFFLERGQFFGLPADKFDGEPGALVESRVSAAGGKLR